jgi:predicted acetylornithine/succinylornithine family transaminase|tara:strand:+ start:153084 stop:154316 length:1233 start_codon:yes stop_codon:yes gene_type:complete
MSSHAENMGAGGELQKCPIMPTYAAPSIMFIRGEGTELWDSEGKRYLDFVGGLAVQSLGHANPEIAEVIGEQAGKLTQVSNYWATEHAHHVAIEIDKAVTGNINEPNHSPYKPTGQVFFCNSGAEANELAFKIARKATSKNRYTVLTATDSFHGRTLAALAACGQPHKHEPFAPMPQGFRHVARGDIKALNNAIDETTAAVHLEPILGEGGVWPHTSDYLSKAEALSKNHGLLFMVDEVQSGLCRTGEWFAFQHYGLNPDVVCIAKALGNGFPIGAVWVKRELAASFEAGDHGSTYGGNPLATAVARKVLEIMKRDNYTLKAQSIEDQVRGSMSKIPQVVSIRGNGAMLAIELDQAISKEVAAEASMNGLLVNPITPTALRLTPPLTTSADQIQEGIQILKGILNAQSSS